MRESETQDPPSISVIVPVRNSAKTIGDLMESLMGLEYDSEKLEIVVVDGDSSDGTRKIVEEYPVLLVDEEGKGLNAARNTGIKWSTGEIVAYTDGDCVVPPDWARSSVSSSVVMGSCWVICLVPSIEELAREAELI